MTPPPMTTSCPGTFGSVSAPVESTMTWASLSTLTPGSGVTDEPVAMMMFFAVTLRSPTLTVVAFSNAARPLSHSTLFFLNRNSIPPVSSLTALAFSACIWSRLSDVPAMSIPNLASAPEDASANSSEAWSIAFDGMQPTLRHVPPSVSRLSAHAVFSPNCAARIAAT